MNPNDLTYFSNQSLQINLNKKTQVPNRPFGATPPTPPRSTSSSMLLFSKYNHQPQDISPETQDSSQHSPVSIDDELIKAKRKPVNQKEQKRRASHSVVERRRRDNITARIEELSKLVSPLSPSNPRQQKLNRAAILQKSVDHIRSLQQLIVQQQQRIGELEALLAEEKHHPTDIFGGH
ncbi:unnamed protein product [Absidia cylindrospora]